MVVTGSISRPCGKTPSLYTILQNKAPLDVNSTLYTSEPRRGSDIKIGRKFKLKILVRAFNYATKLQTLS